MLTSVEFCECWFLSFAFSQCDLCVGAGKVCVPLDPQNCENFNPVTDPPTVFKLLDEIARYDAAHGTSSGSGGKPLKGSTLCVRLSSGCVQDIPDERMMSCRLEENKHEAVY